MRAQLLVRDRRILEPQIRNYAYVVRLVLAHHDDGLCDGRVGCKMRFDLAQFDPVAAHFDLMVNPADELDSAALVAAHQITRAIHAAV